MKPLCIDLFCGLGGWAEGFLAEGYSVVGFDIERHDYGTGGYPGQLVLQDVTTIHGAQFKNATVIVASPPCQAYSYRAMPWKRAKALPPPDNTLFETCFRIQREACEVAGHFIPMIVENVCGAQKYVGRAAWHFRSFYLWGNLPALMPIPCGTPKRAMDDVLRGKRRGGAGLALENGVKQGGGWFHDSKAGARSFSSHSTARRIYAAQIAKIPFPLAQHIARCYKP